MSTPSERQAPFLRVESIRKNFSGVQALDGVTLSLHRGEVLSLIGENGSGKSTLIQIMAGVLAPDSGRIFIDGRQMGPLNPMRAIREGIQVIYQDFSLFPNLSVAENVALTSELAQGRRIVRPGRLKQIAEDALDQLKVDLDPLLLVEELSTARRQIVAICRALVLQSRLIIMDEPTAALTRTEISSLYQVIRRLKERSVAVLFVSHKLEEVLKISDRIAILRGGRKVMEGAVAGVEASELSRQMTGRTLEKRTVLNLGRRKEAAPLLQVEGLSREGAYEEVDLELHSGEILGITGQMGSGQSELAQGLFGLLPCQKGRVHFQGRRLRIGTVRDALKAGFAMLPEDRLEEGLFPEHTVTENLMAVCLDRLARFHILDTERMQRESKKWTRELKIAARSVEAPVRTLSGGNQQRVVLGRWLATDPRLLILNNPTAGVDVGSKYDIHALIRRLAAGGTGVLIISDDLTELLETCHTILVMKKGKISHRVDAAETDEATLMDRVIG